MPVDASRFDQLALTLSRLERRRTLVRGLAGVAIVGILGSLTGHAGAKRKRNHKNQEPQIGAEKKKGKNKKKCKKGQTKCVKACVNLVGDRRNCGRCGNACGVSEVCSGGACIAGCTVCASGCSFSSVKSAVAGAPEGEPILVAPGTYDADIVINRDVSIRRCGDGGEVILRNVGKDARALTIRPEVAVTLEQITVSRNPAFAFGGGIHNEGTLALDHCTFRGNASDPDSDFLVGSAVENRGEVAITACTISENGRSAVSNRSSARLTNTEIRDNEGNAVRNRDGDMVLTGCTIQDNSGSGLTNLDGTVELDGCVIQRNTANQGGGVFSEGVSSVSLTDCHVRDNVAGSAGGIFATSLVMNGCVVSGNRAASSGGGIAAGQASLKDCQIHHNSVEASGGGIAFSGSTLLVENCSIHDNVAGTAENAMFAVGGGVFASWGEATFVDCTIRGNRSHSDGGGVRSLDRMTFDGCTIDDNEATDEGGGLFVEGGSVTFLTGSGNAITNNSARAGGGIHASALATVVLNDTTFEGNSPDNCTAASQIPGCPG
jgi:predicted outer membrane repeat protein